MLYIVSFRLEAALQQKKATKFKIDIAAKNEVKLLEFHKVGLSIGPPLAKLSGSAHGQIYIKRTTKALAMQLVHVCSQNIVFFVSCKDGTLVSVSELVTHFKEIP